jgi:hypothetical protein
VSLPIDIENRKIIPHPVIEFDPPPACGRSFFRFKKQALFKKD